MIYFQVEDIEQKFRELQEQESKKWISESQSLNKPLEKPVAKKSPVSKPFKPKAKGASSSLRAMLAEKRKAMMAAKKSGQEGPDVTTASEKIVSPPKIIEPKVEEEVKFDAGFFNVVSSPKSPAVAVKSARRSDANSLRKSLLHKRVSYSCGNGTPLAIMAATKSIRRSMSRENSPIALNLDHDLAEVAQSEDAGKENLNPLMDLLGPSRKSLAVPSDNLMSFDDTPTKLTPRRSRRISSVHRTNYNENEMFKKAVAKALSPNRTPNKQ